MSERWQPAHKLEGYSVSSEGKVFSTYTNKLRKLTPYDRGRGLHLPVVGSEQHRKVHHLVWEAFNGAIPDGLEVSHKNGDGTDNRLSNLFLVNRNDIGDKSRPAFNGSSKYKGVHWDAERQKWMVTIAPTGQKTKYGGRYATEEAAALAYNELAKELLGPHAYLNEVISSEVGK